MEKLCESCEKRNDCKAPCKPVKAILWAGNRVMERHFDDIIVCYPQGREVHFSEIENFNIEQISSADVVPWSSGDCRLRKTAVFIERFFNRTPYKDLADVFGVPENTVITMYKQALEHVERIIEALDARREGLKATKGDKFTDDQKYFLLASVFGFNGSEIARMFNKDRTSINMKIKRMADKYAAIFSGQDPQEIPIEDPPINAKLARADIVRLVDAYTEQGLSNQQAFKRIADRQGELTGRPVNARAVESRYYKAMKDQPQKSAYEGLSVEEIKQRMML